MDVYFFCCYNDPATTQSYTYRHSPSLHDALPIWLWTEVLASNTPACSMLLPVSVMSPVAAVIRPVLLALPAVLPGLNWTIISLPRVVDSRLSPSVDRSEEHTSELQSLMRISYAVFCLKKKKSYKTNENNYRKKTLNHYNTNNITSIHMSNNKS